jgi:hypothetical protein
VSTLQAQSANIIALSRTKNSKIEVQLFLKVCHKVIGGKVSNTSCRQERASMVA